MNSGSQQVSKISVAPMMAWTDRHCRYLLRQFTSSALLFTEMVSSGALIHGPRERLLRFDATEQPLAIQLGGSDPAEMADAARMAEDAGYIEINLNVGCPSARVQRGRFGACLMYEPTLVAQLVQAMRDQVSIPVTVKCRLGVDDADTQPLLEAFIERVADAGCQIFYIHARKAILGGLSPAQNRQIPPLQPERVYALKQRFPELAIHLNGGICSLEDAAAHIPHVDGIMIGREAYHRPAFLSELASHYQHEQTADSLEVMHRFQTYIEREVAAGTRLHDMTRHCLGMFSGQRGARRFRQMLSDTNRLRTNDPSLLQEAVSCIDIKAA
jgi:tRNA-dihydrouridine synthase A